MRKSLVLLMAIMLAMGLLVSCSDSGGDDVDSDLQGSWLCADPKADGTLDIWMILGEDSAEFDYVEPSGAARIVANYSDNSSKGEMEADGGEFTFKMTHAFNEVTLVWDPATGTSTGTYVLNGNQLTVTADWDPGTPGNESPIFIRQ